MNEDKAQSQLWVQRFLFNAPLYTPNEISFAGATALFVDHFRIEGRCPYCKGISFFSRCRGTKGIASIQALLDSQELCQLEVVCMRDVRHSILFFLHLSKAHIQKAGQYPSPKEIGAAAQVRSRSLLENLQKTFGRHLQQSVLVLRHVFRWWIRQIQRLPSIGEISSPLRLGSTRLLGDIRRMWVSRPSFGGAGIPVTLIVALVCVLTLYQQAKREAEFRQQIREVIQRADEHSTAAPTAKSRIDGLERQLDEKFDVLSKNLDTVRRSITRNDALVAVLNSRLDSSDASTKSDPPRGLQSPSASQPDPKSAVAPIRQDSVDQDQVASAHVDQPSTVQPSATFTQVDQQAANQPVDVFSQVDQRAPIQQEDASAQMADAVPAIPSADPPADAKQKPQKTNHASAPDSAAGAKPDTPRTTVDARPKATPADRAVPHLGIGVAPLTSGLAAATRTTSRRGLMITVVDPGSPAERAGVQAHDLLLKVDGTAVNRPDQVREALFSLKGKRTLVLTLRRGDKIEHVKLKVG
ncbi:MAG: PDZ domain-containing protein [Methylovirgula sp.]